MNKTIRNEINIASILITFAVVTQHSATKWWVMLQDNRVIKSTVIFFHLYQNVNYLPWMLKKHESQDT